MRADPSEDPRTEQSDRLAALRDELQEDMRRISTVDPSTVGIGFGKRIGDGTAIAVDRMEQVKVHDQMRVKLDELDRAAVKADEGTYGTCDVCGGDIGAERLEHLPAATRCVTCAGWVRRR